jgi:hypothetical protein
MFVWLISQIEAAGYASISMLYHLKYSLLLAAAVGCLLSPFAELCCPFSTVGRLPSITSCPLDTSSSHRAQSATWLPVLGRVLLTLTFLDDAMRIFFNFDGQVR